MEESEKQHFKDTATQRWEEYKIKHGIVNNEQATIQLALDTGNIIINSLKKAKEIMEKRESSPAIDMAIDRIQRPDRTVFEKPTTEEHEKRKREVASAMSSDLIDSFSPEDRYDIFIEIRDNLERALRSTCEEMACKLEAETKYFNQLKNLVY